MILDVNTAKPYNVTVHRNILDKVGELSVSVLKEGTKVLIVSDSNVAPLYSDRVKSSYERAGFKVSTFVFDAGEERKNLDTFGKILGEAAKLSFCRDDAFVALGGGVTGDITGFAAACYMRGIRCVQIPTSLLAAIDSSVGGKTGVDLVEGKNLVGAFYQPAGVFFDPDVLDTLPEKEWKNGMGEGVKYAVLCGGRIREILKSGVTKDTLEEFCTLCIAYKAEVVSKDEKEGNLRQLLNLGHTVGHAEEKLAKYTICHGEAVAAGIAVMAKAAGRVGDLPQSELDEIMKILEKNGLLREPLFERADLAKAAANDKKAHGDTVNAVTIHAFGDCRVTKMTLDEFGEYIK